MFKSPHPLSIMWKAVVLAVCLLVSGVQPMDDPTYGVKLCGREFIRAVIFTCGGSRWKRSVINAGKLTKCTCVSDYMLFSICPNSAIYVFTGLKRFDAIKGNRKYVYAYKQTAKREGTVSFATDGI